MATLTGTSGNDTIYSFNNSSDSISGGAGNDYLGLYFYDYSNDTLDGGEGNDTLYGSWYGNDILLGGTGNDYLNGYGGNNNLDGGAGDDSLYGNTQAFPSPSTGRMPSQSPSQPGPMSIRSPISRILSARPPMTR